MTTLASSSFTCPICNHTFTDTVIMSTNNFGGVETDFRNHAVGFDPLPHYVHQCPECYFSMMGNNFPASDDLKEYVLSKEIFEGMSQDVLRETSTKYEIYGRALAFNQNPDEQVGWAYLRASWMARSERNRDDEKRLQLLAVKYFEKTFNERTLNNPEDYVHIKFLIGELYRRVESFSKAIEWLSQVGEPREGIAQRQLALAEQEDSSPTFFNR
ncbi:MAG: DUF2225 domain-containing protein [Promethearchaeota archaeon]